MKLFQTSNKQPHPTNVLYSGKKPGRVVISSTKFQTGTTNILTEKWACTADVEEPTLSPNKTMPLCRFNYEITKKYPCKQHQNRVFCLVTVQARCTTVSSQPLPPYFKHTTHSVIQSNTKVMQVQKNHKLLIQ